jgi:outer membrane receptor protein involved in Fe transport
MLCALGLGAPSFAASPEPEIVVTASTPLGHGPTGFGSFSSQDLQNGHGADLTDYLRRSAAGVFINDVQNNPLQPDVSYRGFTASPLLGTPQGLSVYVDGVRLNQPFGDVVSWDLVPKSAIGRVTVIEGGAPLFGRNTLGGALNIETRSGKTDPGTALEAALGSWDRHTFSARTGAAAENGFNYFVSGDYFKEDGWRDFSPSEAKQVFGKLGWSDARTDVALSGVYADTDLNGNGLQEMRLLNADRSSVYTWPDNTANLGKLLNLTAQHAFSDAVSLKGQVFWREIETRTINGDINEESLGESLYQPSAAERIALAAAGYSGFPLSGETQDNTPFPRWRCIANILLNSEPNEKCNGLDNRTATDQSEWGGTIEASFKGDIAGRANSLVVGANATSSNVRFNQGSQFGYLTPGRGVVTVAGPGAFADGTQDSEGAFDARVQLSGTTRTESFYIADGVALSARAHLDLSARYDRTKIRTRDAITPGGGTGSLDGDHQFEKLNPALGLSWSASPTLKLTFGVSQSSRAPSAIELGCADSASPCRLPNALAGDPPLNQVVARTLEAGVRGARDWLSWRVGAFRIDNRDDILFVASEQTGFGYFRNFGKTRRQGVEAEAAASFGAIQISASYTFLDAAYRSPETVGGAANSANEGPAPGFEGEIAIEKGDRIPLIPRHIAKAEIAWQATPRLRFNADAIAVSGVIARGNENNDHQADGLYYLGPGKTDAYAVFNLGGEWAPTKALTFFAQVNNVLDEQYATAAQLGRTGFSGSGAFVARPFAGPVIGGERPGLSSTFYAPGAPRSFLIGVRAAF